MKVALLVLSLALVVLADQAQFQAWMSQYNKVYSQDNEYAKRYANFMENLRIIEEQNAKNDGLLFGLNQFSDLTAFEFKSTVLMRVNEAVQPKMNSTFVLSPNAPTTFDWRDKKAVTAVKDQGQCGSCWAFSATEAIESSWILAGKASESLNLAPQQIVDCDKADGGCNGGWPDSAMKYVRDAGGQEGTANYPYTAKNGACHFASNMVQAKVASLEQVTKPKDENTLQNNLVNVGPPSICVDASKWQSYRSGVMTHSQCCPGSCSLDHCVQLVGYNAAGAQKYWIVRNSWGGSWGTGGYIWLEMGSDTCGLTQHVYWPISPK